MLSAIHKQVMELSLGEGMSGLLVQFLSDFLSSSIHVSPFASVPRQPSRIPLHFFARVMLNFPEFCQQVSLQFNFFPCYHGSNTTS